MKKVTCAVCLSLAVLIGGLSLSGSYAFGKSRPEDPAKALQVFSSDRGQALQATAIGPGLVNLSPSDEFSTYQWGLKNDGEFRLIELQAKFRTVDQTYSQTRSGVGIGIPKPGPDDYKSIVTHAVTGVDIAIQPAWKLYDQAETKRSVTVAIIDTGIDIHHQELKNSLWTNPGEVDGDGIDNDGNGYVDDIYGWNFYSGNNQVFVGNEDSHGTHAAGTIGADRGSYGIAGITDNNYVKLMTLKALGGEDGAGSPEAVIQAIRYAEAMGASICNLSMGTTAYSEALDQAIRDSSMLFVVSCGNGGVSGHLPGLSGLSSPRQRDFRSQHPI